jgi:hypothetical protein
VAREAHRWAQLLFGLAVLLLLAGGLAAWRLAQGPLELDFLARAIEAQANAPDSPSRLEIGQASIAWQGWREGHLTPVELRLSRVAMRGADGVAQAELPDATLSLSLPWLLRGELAPRVLELQQPVLRLWRDAEGRMGLGLGAPPAADAAEARGGASALEGLLAEMMHPPGDDTPLGALARLRIAGGRVSVEDAALGGTWVLDAPMIELRRLPAGGIALQARGLLRLGDQAVAASLRGEFAGTPAEGDFTLTIPALSPAALAGHAPALAALAALDAPARLEIGGRLNAAGVLMAGQAVLGLGAGHLDLGQGRRIAIAEGEALVTLAAAGLAMPRARLRLAGPAAPVLTATADAVQGAEGWRATLRLGLDALNLAELGRHWPAGIRDSERGWLVENLTAGMARNGQWEATAEVPADFSALRVTALSGTLEVSDATVHWLRPVPPAERAQGSLSFGLREVALRVTGGRQGGVQLREGTVRFLLPEAGIESADIQLQLAGPVPDVLAVVQHPRLRLFERRPLPIKDPRGSMEGRVSIAFPLLADLPVEQLRVRAQARLRDVRMADVLMGRPLERGQFELTVDNEGLRANGTATLAEIAARIGVEMDFRAGPPTQVVMRETVSTRTDARTLAALGLATEELVRGPVGLDVRSERRRSGAGRVAVRAELREATLALPPLGWAKPAGQNAGADLVLRMNGEALEAIESFRAEAPSLLLRGNAAFGRGTRIERVTVNEAVIEGSRFVAEARPPARPEGPWAVTLRGPALDLRRALADDSPAEARGAESDRGPAFALEARFERVLLGPQRELAAVEARGQVDALGVVREGRISGRAGPRGAFEALIAPSGAGRSLRLTAEDAGALLESFDVLRHLEGGRLSLEAQFESNRPGAALRGTAEMSDFAVRNAPGFAKLLQAMTLYGLVEALSGTGLGFARLVAPFTLTPETLTLEEARAFSASLGLTAKGTMNRRTRRLAVEGTIVPAYFFNSLLGNIPLLGRIFSPETGGGLFAATFRLNGPADDPAVSVNPLAALTPGFLRGIFGIGQQPASP